MSISMVCDGCGKRYAVDDRAAGKRVRCKGCGAVMAVPAAAPEPAGVPVDVFGFDDEPIAPADRPGVGHGDEEEAEPPVLRSRPKGKKKRRDQLVLFGLSGPALWLLPAGAAVVLLVGLTVPTVGFVTGGAVLVLSLVVAVAGGGDVRALIARESFGTKAMVRTVPLYAVVYASQRWHEPAVRKAALGSLLGGLMGLGAIFQLLHTAIQHAPGHPLAAAEPADPVDVEEAEPPVEVAAAPPPAETPAVAADPIARAVREFRSDDEYTRQMAARALFETPPRDDRRPVVAAALARHFRDPASDVRVEALRAGLAWGVDGAFEAALAELKDYHGIMGQELTEALAATGDPRAAAALVDALREEYHDAGPYVEVALVRMGPVAEPPLLEALPDLPPGSTIKALTALGEIGTEASLPLLRELADDPARRVFAERALASLRARGIRDGTP